MEKKDGNVENTEIEGKDHINDIFILNSHQYSSDSYIFYYGSGKTD